MGYRGRGHWNNQRNQDMDIDLSGNSRGAYVHTHRGDDNVVGSDHRDWIRSGRGDDTVEGGGGNDIMFGGRGQDVAVFSGSILDYNIVSFGCGRWTFVSGEDGCDFLHSFETLQFDDFTYNSTGNNGPLAVLRSTGLSTAENNSFGFEVDVYDLDGDAVSLQSVSVSGGGTVSATFGAAEQGSITGSSNGLSVSFDPGSAYDTLAVGESANETVTLVISDGQGGTTEVAYEITIEGENDGPVATAVAAIAGEDGPAVVIGASYSDVDTTDTHTISVDASTALGSVSNNGDGTFSYDASGAFDHLANGETATDEFTFTVDDGNGGTATETVTVTVSGQNDSPVATAVIGSSDEDGPAITIASDYSDVDVSDTHTFSVDASGTLGSVTNNGDGTFGYSANGAFEALAAGETATDTFTYTVDDGNGGTSTSTATVTVTGQNDAPVAEAVAASVGEDAQTVVSGSVGAYVTPNAGRHYVFDFDTGIATTIPRDFGANKTPQQIADQHLTNGNGIIVGPNPNNEGWGFSGSVFVDGVEDIIPSTDFAITDTSGNTTFDLSNSNWIAFPDANTDVEDISVTITGIALPDGRSVDVSVSASQLEYEYSSNDNIRVASVDFEAAINHPSPEITIAADVNDIDSDTFVFDLNSNGTLGSVTDNGDGTFTYSANGAFEHLDGGETATDSFIYNVDDGDGGLDSNVVTVTILGSDDLVFV